MKVHNRLRAMLAGASIAAVATAVPASAQQAGGGAPAQAMGSDQESTRTPSDSATVPVEQSFGLEAIIVTARKQEENLQDVPISVTAFSGEALQARSVTSVADISTYTPNTRLRAHPSDPTSIVSQIRGQVQTDILATLDPSVGTYVDGIYWARAFGANASLLDIQRAEVLKGPQGTLFGRNTTGGALNIKSNDPDFDGISGLVSGTAGNHDQLEGTAIVNLPLVADKVALRVAGTVTSFGGYGRDTVSGRRLNDYDSWIGRAKLLVQPTENLRLLFSAEWYDFEGAGSTPALIFAAPNSAAVFEVLAESAGRDSIFNYVYDGTGSPFNVAIGIKPYNRVETETYSATAALETDWGVITAIVGHRKYGSHRSEDLDGTPYTVLTPLQDSDGRQWSQELQFTGKAFADQLDFTVGLFNFDERIPFDSEISNALVAINPNAPARSEGRISNRAMAIYSQGTFRFSDAFSITGGLRYSVDDRQINSSNNTGPTRACSVPVPLRRDPAVCLSNQQRSDTGWTYLLSANFEPTEDLLFYARTAKGIRSGGFQLRGGAFLEDYTPFDPETVTDYEVGVKAELFDRRVRFNAAAYYSDYKDIQRSTIIPRAGGGLSTVVSNAASARVIGGEAELTAIVFEGFEINGAVGITDPKYSTFVERGSGADRSGEEFESVPKFTAAAGAQYTRDLGFGTLTLRADYSHTSKQVQARNTRPPFTEVPAYDLVNARIALQLADPDLEIAAFARNLLDNRYRFYSLDLFGPGLGVVAGYYGAPRQIGVQATFKFGS